MGFEPRSVRKINDAGRDVIDGGVSIVAGNRAQNRRTATGSRTTDPWRGRSLPSPVAQRRSLGRARGRARRKQPPGRSCGWAERRQPPARTGAPIRTVSRRCCDCPLARRDERSPGRVGTHGAQALAAGSARRTQAAEAAAGGSFRSRRSQANLAPAASAGCRLAESPERGRRKRFETGQRERRGRNGAARLRGSPPAAKVPPERPAASVGQADWRRWRCRRRASRRHGAGAVDAEVHREKIASGAAEPRQCSTQTPTAPARATAAAPGRILRRTRRGLSPPSNERSSNVASIPCIPRPTLTPRNSIKLARTR